MPIMMALALLAQDPTLPADPDEAMRTCGAVALVGDGMPDIGKIVVASYFALSLSKTQSPDEVVNKAVDEIDTITRRSMEVRADAAALMPLCRARFPLAWASGPVTLPAEPFNRRIMCTAAVGTYVGLVGESNSNTARLAQRFGRLVTDEEMAERGIVGRDGFRREVGKQLAASTSLGNLEAIVQSCETAFPG